MAQVVILGMEMGCCKDALIATYEILKHLLNSQGRSFMHGGQQRAAVTETLLS